MSSQLKPGRGLGAALLLVLLPLVLLFWSFLSKTLASAALSDAATALAAIMNQADRLANDLDLELSFLDAVFQRTLLSPAARLAAPLESYRLEARWPDSVKSIQVVDAASPVAPDLAMFASLSRVLRIERVWADGPDAPATYRALVAVLDENCLTQQVFPDLAQSYFGEGSGFEQYAVTVRDSDGELRFSTAGIGDPAPDFVRPLLRDVGRFDVARFYSTFSPRSMQRDDPVAFRAGEITFPGAANPATGTVPAIDRYRFQVSESAGWTLEVSHRGSTIEEAERMQARLWSLAVLCFLGILYGSLAMLYLSARRTAGLASSERAFVASVTHELKTPIAIALSAGENLAKGIVPPDRVSQYGETVAREARRLSGSVERMLTLAGLESAQHLASGEAVNLAEAAQTVMARLSAFASSKGASFEFAYSRRAIVDGSRVLVESALESVMSNAVKYAGGTIRLAVHETTRRGRSYAVFTCSDSGPGMSRQDRARAFDPFWRGRASSGQDGTGVGLYLARRICAMHAGHAKLRCPPEGGTVLELSFRSFV